MTQPIPDSGLVICPVTDVECSRRCPAGVCRREPEGQPSDPQAGREAVAAIIDPRGFDDPPFYKDQRWRDHQEAFAKADAIIALLASRPSEGGDGITNGKLAGVLVGALERDHHLSAVETKHYRQVVHKLIRDAEASPTIPAILPGWEEGQNTTFDAFTILNEQGQIWTRDYWQSAEQAERYKTGKGIDKHTVVPVRVWLAALPTPADPVGKEAQS